jgi:hypothetical protein
VLTIGIQCPICGTFAMVSAHPEAVNYSRSGAQAGGDRPVSG